MIIVDASVVIERLIQGEYTAHARSFFNTLTRNSPALVPEFCYVECANVVWKHVRFQSMPVTLADVVLVNLRALPLTPTSVTELLDDALGIGLRQQLAVYDSTYTALAKRLNYPLLTIDQRQAHAAQSEGLPVTLLTDYP